MANVPAKQSSLSSPWELFGFPWQSVFGQGIKVEEFTEGDVYVLRAELPGLDVERDVRIRVAGGVLRIQAERASDHKEAGGHSEFHYGVFTRAVTLPQGVKEDTITATYRDGILEIRVELPTNAHGREIPIKVT